jgi:hypothetical protein
MIPRVAVGLVNRREAITIGNQARIHVVTVHIGSLSTDGAIVDNVNGASASVGRYVAIKDGRGQIQPRFPNGKDCCELRATHVHNRR